MRARLSWKHTDQGDPRPQANGARANDSGDGRGKSLRDSLSQPLPAFTGDRLTCHKDELAPAKARRKPFSAAELIVGKMEQSAGDFGQCAVSGRFAIGKIHSVEPAQPDNQGVHRRRRSCPVARQTPLFESDMQRSRIGKPGQRIAGKRKVMGRARHTWGLAVNAYQRFFPPPRVAKRDSDN